MTKLDRLIVELCPNGVEYKTLGEIGEFVRGSGLQKKDFTESGVGCIHYGQIYTYYCLFTYKTKSFVSPQLAKILKKVQTGDLIIASTSENIEDVCKTVAWLGTDEIVTGGHSTIFKHSQNPKYLVYYFTTQTFFDEKRKYAKGTKVIDISAKDLAKIRVPLPPLSVQKEIVRILDKFTMLEAELETELELRKKQYGHYRNSLLTFNINYGTNKKDSRRLAHLMTLGEVAMIQSGGTPSKNKKEYWTNGTIKWLGSTVCRNRKTIDEVTDYITEEGLKKSSAKMLKEQTTLIALVGATIGKVAFLPFEAAVNQNIAALYPIDTDQLNASYLYYACCTLYEKFTALSNEKFSMANLSFVRGLIIPVPSLEEQERIVSILDRFDALTNDITSGLPAEIAARRKQYEYYRNKLLMFMEVV